MEVWERDDVASEVEEIADNVDSRADCLWQSINDAKNAIEQIASDLSSAEDDIGTYSSDIQDKIRNAAGNVEDLDCEEDFDPDTLIQFDEVQRIARLCRMFGYEYSSGTYHHENHNGYCIKIGIRNIYDNASLGAWMKDAFLLDKFGSASSIVQVNK